MSIKFTKRVAAEVLDRGESSIWIKPDAIEDAKKAITRDDVRKLIKDGTIVAVKPQWERHKKSPRTVKKRGMGRRKGTAKARQGRLWEKKVRSQRFLLRKLKLMGRVDKKTFNRYYLLVKGNAFNDKRSLLLHLSDEGIKVSEEERKQINEQAKSAYR